ncbi:MAG TPA: MaoC/PaaZ C-terminal domain-containing protein [Pseudonocardia sp.]|uniref:MaoC/PaaZ C-terminal domain-containing protein n=1 Tax=Pseudonocardia sp. TaxID=60912 RepID=UPI002B77EC92|nr:MaoC/PaaZ C-terminal domain-containing protein [Pseudonocardia sp.]HTF47718.1 MaoC/PaaZ C-terminal domain-containing protein [Pseudonocardia sp.]
MIAAEVLDKAPRLGPRYALALLPGRGGGGALPNRELALHGLRVDAGGLADYAHVCGFAVDGTLPVTYPQVLAFGAQIRLMTEPGFPLRLPGLVHLRQRIRQHRPIGLEEPLDLRVRAADLRGHPRGAQVDLLASVSVAGEPVWAARSTYLSRGVSAPTQAAAEPEPAEVSAPLSARWRLAGDIGRRYASVSGDVNPIHLHPLAARLFGFPGAIAHGMWTAARCVATLAGRLPEAYDVDVVFRKPVVLPTTVELHTARTDTGWALTLRGAGSDRIHLIMSVDTTTEDLPDQLG